MSVGKGTLTATSETLPTPGTCAYCGGRRLYCFFDPEWKEHVPVLDFSGVRMQTVWVVE